jgi:hypothetical protein
MLTIGHDAAVQTALPLLFGCWTLKENRVARPMWGRKIVQHSGSASLENNSENGPVKLSHEVLLLPKGKLEQPLDSALRGLEWRLSFKDIYAQGRLEFKIVHPPPEKKLVANDQLPSIHYYSGVFCEGLDRVEGWVERYADIEDEKLGPIRKKVRIGQFCLKKKREEKEEAAGSASAAAAAAPAAVAAAAAAASP